MQHVSKKKKRENLCAHQYRRHGVFVINIQVTLPIIRNHNPGHLAIHPKVWVVIADKHQQTHRVIPPADLLLSGNTWCCSFSFWYHQRQVNSLWNNEGGMTQNQKITSMFKSLYQLNLTPQTAACMMASKPHSGKSMFADTRCFAIISLNLSVLLVSDKTCLYPKVGRQVSSGVIPLKNSRSQKQNFEKQDYLRCQMTLLKLPTTNRH